MLKQEILTELKAETVELLDTIPLMLAFWDLDFNMMYCNQTAADVLGCPSKAHYLANFFDYVPEYQSCGTLSVEKIPRLIAETVEKRRIDTQWQQVHTNGEIIPMDIIIVCGTYLGDDGVFVLATDKRELTAAQNNIKKMHEEQERIRLMFNTVPLVIDYWDLEGKCIDCNQFALEQYRFTTKEEYLQNVYTLSPTTQPNGETTVNFFKKYLQEAVANGSASSSLVAQRMNGELIMYETFATRIEVNGQPAVVSCARDVTDKVQAEVSIANSQAKSRFLARMSHELRTPISVILGISEIELQDPTLTAHMDEALAKIHESGETLLALVNDILDLSKIEAGKMELIEADYEVPALMGDIITAYPVYLGEKDIRFSIEMDKHLPAKLFGDYLRIKQILTNLLSNAFKYTEHGSVHLTFRCSEFTDDSAVVEIIVKDTGRGMAKDQVDKLFEDYTRFHEKELTAAVGTGLGMSIIYNFVKLMQGTVNVESAVGVGTTVTLRLPQKIVGYQMIGAQKAADLESLQVELNPELKKSKFTRATVNPGRVLVVDDIAANLYVAKGLLSFYNLDIETCLSGQEALEKIKAGNTYDIAFIDQMMPGINGTETMKEMRAMGYTLPIVALTANALIGQSEEFLKAGFDGFISKPINTSYLDSILVKFLNTQSVDAGDMDNYLSEIEYKLREDFAKGQRHTIQEIETALADGYIKTAHRKAHSLKGLAALIKEEKLAALAQVVELAINNNTLTQTHLQSLAEEMEKVLNKIAPKRESNNEAKEILNALEPLLIAKNAEAINLVEKLSPIPHAAILVHQVKDYDFRTALKSLRALAVILNV